MLNLSKMATCACTGVRSCLICNKKDEDTNEQKNDEKITSFSFCINCERVFAGFSCRHDKNTNYTGAEDIPLLTGVTVIENFISEDEELYIMSEIEKFPWRASQSGRMKQDFGPKANFKKKKVKIGRFSGLPNFSHFIVERIKKDVPLLSNFIPVELCNLDYNTERGASIDPHLDDIWLWGEHLVTINLLSDTFLTLTNQKHEVKIPMPRFSLFILKGTSRYQWMHGIERSDIKSRRIAVTLRELSSQFLSGPGYDEIGKTVLELAASFDGLPTSS